MLSQGQGPLGCTQYCGGQVGGDLAGPAPEGPGSLTEPKGRAAAGNVFTEPHRQSCFCFSYAWPW